MNERRTLAEVLPDVAAIVGACVLGALGTISGQTAVTAILAVLAGRLYPRGFAFGRHDATPPQGPPTAPVTPDPSAPPAPSAAAPQKPPHAPPQAPSAFAVPSGVLTLAAGAAAMLCAAMSSPRAAAAVIVGAGIAAHALGA